MASPCVDRVAASLDEPRPAQKAFQNEKDANCRTITLSKAQGEKIGVTVVARPSFPERVVMEVQALRLGGVLDKHNKLQPDAAMHQGDVVMSVNGVHGDFDAMFAQFAKDSVVFEVERREAQVHAL